MAERAIQNKVAQSQFLDTFAPRVVFLDELIREKLECGKFPVTKTGWTKITAVLVCAAALALFLAQNWDGVCTDTPDWFIYVFTMSVGSNLVVELTFYMIFSWGITVTNPGKWVSADILANLIFSLVGICGSAAITVTKTNCTENVEMHKIPGPLGIAGGIISVIGCVAIFLMYRYVEEEEPLPPPLKRDDPRQMSMHA